MSERPTSPPALTASAPNGAALPALLVALVGFALAGAVAGAGGQALSGVWGGPPEGWTLSIALPIQGLVLVGSARLMRAPFGFQAPTSLSTTPIALLGLLGAQAWVELVTSQLGLDRAALDNLDAALLGPAGLPVAIGAVVFAAAGEELFFRGALFSSIRDRYGPVWAWLMSSALFAIWHGDPLHALAALCGGLWLGWVRLRSGSIWPSLALHALNNLAWVLAARLSDAPHLGLEAGLLAIVAAIFWEQRIGRELSK